MARIEYPFADPFDFQAFESHYAQWLGIGSHHAHALRGIAMEYCYGGLPLKSLYAEITFEPSTTQPLHATIALRPTRGCGLPPLVIHDVSLRQFLASGMPKKDWYQNGWIGPDHLWAPKEGGYWADFADAQYRLELAHAETWRWSIVFKKNNQAIGGARITGGDRLSHIELVNNCTTTTGFEWKVSMNGRSYHGSIQVDDAFSAFYRRLSERQAGSLPMQSNELTTGDPRYAGESRVFGFGPTSVYGASKGWGPGYDSLTPGNTIRIDLNRYRSLAPAHEIPVAFSGSNIDRGAIVYDRYGQKSPYFEKPKIRGLSHSIRRSQGGPEEKQLPGSYSDIEAWHELNLPNFEPVGIYNHASRVCVHGHRWLYALNACVIRRIAHSGHQGQPYELEFQHTGNQGAFQLRRVVLGNLDLQAILASPTPSTIHRFGYGARPTVMDYDPAFRPPTDPAHPGPYAFLLAGPDDQGRCDYFICPEAFGVERAILTGDPLNRTITVELVSFERILLLWRATFPVPDLGHEPSMSIHTRHQKA